MRARRRTWPSTWRPCSRATRSSRSSSHGGHLTHGLKVNFSGRLYTIVHYGVSRETNVVDYDEVLRLAKRPPSAADRLRRLGVPAHRGGRQVPRDRGRGRCFAALRHGPLRRARRGRPPSESRPARPLRHLDHPQDAGRASRSASSSATRSARRRSTAPSSRASRAGPLMHTIAAKAACFKIASTEAFREYQGQIRTNADVLADTLQEGGLDVLTGGTDTHLLQLDLRSTEWTGKEAEERLAEVKLTVNRNTVPFDERPPTVASGSESARPRPRCAASTSTDFREVGHDDRRGARREPGSPARWRREARRSARSGPLYPGFRGFHHVRGVSRQASPVVAHPLVQHKLSYLRDQETPTVHFRKLANEVTLLLDVRGDEGLSDRAGGDRDAARADGRRSGSRARRWRSARCSGPASECSTGCCRSSRAPASVSSACTATRRRSQPVEYYVKLPATSTSATRSCSIRCSRPATRAWPRSSIVKTRAPVR